MPQSNWVKLSIQCKRTRDASDAILDRRDGGKGLCVGRFKLSYGDAISGGGERNGQKWIGIGSCLPFTQMHQDSKVGRADLEWQVGITTTRSKQKQSQEHYRDQLSEP